MILNQKSKIQEIRERYQHKGAVPKEVKVLTPAEITALLSNPKLKTAFETVDKIESEEAGVEMVRVGVMLSHGASRHKVTIGQHIREKLAVERIDASMRRKGMKK